MKRILQKPKEEGQSAYIRESSVNIQPHQVIMSRNSRLVKLIREQQAKELKELEKDPEANAEKISVLDNEIKNWKGLYAAGFRYPVPSKYNPGAFEIVIAEDFEEAATEMVMVK